ncbi:acyltransferase [Solwaraspora sp. WMMD1047]|uniref:acyltransferase family protein n=1 Tax=Solwaraspora sp. WMMD1047 TaxID=3016102 RepID=UPI002417B990|nr:acyltransferase [Solwaraspora sp. WMMD1047]MDG4831833.1 acyltransferase [Solwaraspora sp. WMMD1047]
MTGHQAAGPTVTGHQAAGPTVTGHRAVVSTVSRSPGVNRPTDRDTAAGDPTARDRSIDGLRAYAIVAVVVGHWLVTGLVVAPDGSLGQASPLTAMPALAPATWFLQALGLFFLTGGYASARSLRRAGERGTDQRTWLVHRLRRLALPAGALLAAGAGVLVAADALGVPGRTLRTAGMLAVSPLWFLLAFAALAASTGPLLAAVRRFGPVAVAAPAIAVVAASDLVGRLAGPAANGWRTPVALLAAWLVPYLLGLVLAGGGLDRRRTAWWLALGGAAGLVALVTLAGYPASAVGVPGAGASNLSPPSLAAVSLAVAQIGVALLLRDRLTGLMRRPAWWNPVRRLNRAAAGSYLCHQPVLVGLALLALFVVGRTDGPTGGVPADSGVGGVGADGVGGAVTVPGLLAEPDGPAWIAARLGWFPVLAAVLGFVLWRVYDDSRSGSGRAVEVIAVRDSDPPSRGRAGLRSR